MSLDEQDWRMLRMEFMPKDECNERQTKIDRRFANDDKRIELLASKFRVWDKLFWVIATSSIGSLVTAIFQLIFK